MHYKGKKITSGLGNESLPYTVKENAKEIIETGFINLITLKMG